MRLRQGILKSDDLNPDGVRIVVNWDNMVTSSSVFVPCVDAQEAIRQIKNIVKNKRLGRRNACACREQQIRCSHLENFVINVG